MTKAKTRSKLILIGITPDFDPGERIPVRSPDEGTVYLKDRYYRAVSELGAIPVILPMVAKPRLIEGLLDRLDGLLLSGGGFDIHPKFYGEEPIPALGTVKENRTEFELEIFRLALRRDLPVLGICGGAQAINVALGGTLYQDLPTQRPHSISHQQTFSKTRPSHSVTVPAGTTLAAILGRKRSEHTIRVNSTHHQAVKDVGKGLVVNAVAADGVIEAIAGPAQRLVLGVQWHPEMLVPDHADQVRLFRAFLAAAKKRH